MAGRDYIKRHLKAINPDEKDEVSRTQYYQNHIIIYHNIIKKAQAMYYGLLFLILVRVHFAPNPGNTNERYKRIQFSCGPISGCKYFVHTHPIWKKWTENRPFILHALLNELEGVPLFGLESTCQMEVINSLSDSACLKLTSDPVILIA